MNETENQRKDGLEAVLSGFSRASAGSGILKRLKSRNEDIQGAAFREGQNYAFQYDRNLQSPNQISPENIGNLVKNAADRELGAATTYLARNLDDILDNQVPDEVYDVLSEDENIVKTGGDRYKELIRRRQIYEASRMLYEQVEGMGKIDGAKKVIKDMDEKQAEKVLEAVAKRATEMAKERTKDEGKRTQQLAAESALIRIRGGDFTLEEFKEGMNYIVQQNEKGLSEYEGKIGMNAIKYTREIIRKMAKADDDRVLEMLNAAYGAVNEDYRNAMAENENYSSPRVAGRIGPSRAIVELENQEELRHAA